eukprot:3773909-Pyramimonas_sp.AAC.1
MAGTLDDVGMDDVASTPRQTATFNLDEPVTCSKRDDAESMISLGSAALGGKVDAQKYIDVLDLEVAQQSPKLGNLYHHATNYSQRVGDDKTKDANIKELKNRLELFGHAQRFNSRHEGSYTYDALAASYDTLVSAQVRMLPVANAVIWKKKVDMMLQADVTKESASAMFRACAPIPLPASMDEAFDVRAPCLSRLSAVDERCNIQRFYLYFCESWFLPKLESGCHEEIISSIIVDMRQYITRVLESCHIGEVTV